MVTVDLERVQRLRERFLQGRRGRRAMPDYWRDARDLAAYDAILGARIGWKWDAALAECAARGWRPSAGHTVLDFGCGSGVAARRYVDRFGASEVRYHDRSPHAMAFAVERMQEGHAHVAVVAQPSVRDLEVDVVLVSHVVSELDERGLQQLEQLLRRCPRAIVVESGNRPVARRLAALRDRLLDQFGVVAPCPHRQPCPTLANDDDWCHFFASPPGEVFTDGDWVKAARSLGIDLRSLPYAFVALDRDAADAGAQIARGQDPSVPNLRVLGRASINPVVATAQACSASGLESIEVHKRTDARLWRALKKNPEQAQELLQDRP
jgi:SAM-dependent methyltransferase